MQYYIDRLMEYRDEKNALFQQKLTPGVEPEAFLGVRVPNVRKLAKELVKREDHMEFLEELPHSYFDENMLHALIISEYKDYGACVEALEKFLPYVDNWAVCDSMSPKVFRKHRKELLVKIQEWIPSEKVYTCRFGIEMLMSWFLGDQFRPEYHEWVAAVHSEEYYVNMMIAWYFATALAKNREETIPYIMERRLDRWVHNKTIQKAVESYRITPEQKDELRTMRWK